MDRYWLDIKFIITWDDCCFSLPSKLSKNKREISKFTLISSKKSFLYVARSLNQIPKKI